MNFTTTTRQSMLIAGLLQGAAMVALHEWFKSNGFTPPDLLWAVPVYALVVLGPITFNFLRSEFPAAQAMKAAAVAVGAIAVTGAWLGWSFGVGGGARQTLGPDAGPLFVFGASSLVAWFIALPFLQARLRENAFSFPYARLFDDAWRNTLLVTNCALFTALFWVLLALWAGLFMVLNIGFFKDLFTSRFFFYVATAMAMSFAVSLEEKEASALGALRRHLLAFKTRLLPLAALIVILFLGALPFTGLDPLWSTGRTTPLILSLQVAIIALTNSAWQDGAQPPPFSKPVQWLTRAAITSLPVLSIICIWSLSQRIDQYGWSVDRVWAAVLVGLTTLYAAGYGISAVMTGWMPTLGAVNTWMAMLAIATLLAVHTPLLDPQRMSANSQIFRLLSGRVEIEKFDFNYLRFELGRSGDEALKALTELSGHPKAEEIRTKAKQALTLQNRYGTREESIPAKEQIAANLEPKPAATKISPAFVDYLHERLSKSKFDYALNALKSGKRVPLLIIDLGADPFPEYVLMAAPFPVFTQYEGKWRQIGQINFAHPNPQPEDLQRWLASGDVAVVPRPWSDLRLGDRSGALMLRTERSPE